MGATATAESGVLSPDTLKGYSPWGCSPFALGTTGGILLGKPVDKLTGGKVNPLIRIGRLPALPMAARVSDVMGQKENPSNFLFNACYGTLMWPE